MYKILILLTVFISLSLRIFSIDKLPAGLNQEEIFHAWNTHLLVTQHSFLEQLSPETPSYPHLYSILALPIFQLFGYGIWQLRILSALAGVLSALILYLLTIRFFKPSANDIPVKQLALLTAMLFSISPWSIHFSRFASSANLNLLIYLVGMFLYFVLTQQSKFVLQIFMSLILVVLCFFSSFEVVMLLFVSYLILYISNEHPRLFWIFYFLLALIIAILAANHQLTHYLQYFSFSFLFFEGGQDLTYNVREVGPLLLSTFPFFLVGLYQITKTPRRGGIAIILLFLITPIPGALLSKNVDPSTAIYMLPYLCIFIALGLFSVYTNLFNLIQRPYQKPFSALYIVLVAVAFAYSLLTYLHIYQYHYPLRAWPQWAMHWTAGAQYIAQEYPATNYVVMEESPYVVYYLRFFDLVYGNTTPRYVLGQESAAESYPELPAGAVVAIGGWRSTPENFQYPHHITLPNREQSIIYKIGIWQKI